MSPSTSQYTDYIDSSYSWFRLGICLLIATIGSVGMWSIIVIMPLIENEFGLDRATTSLPFTAIMMGFGAGNLLLGRIVDRVGLFTPVLLSAFLLSGGFYLTTLTTDIWLFSTIQGLLIGLGTATCFGPLMSDISHWFQKRLGIAIAIAASGNYFAGMIWPLALKSIVEDEGWRAAQLVIATTILLVVVPLSFFLRKRLPSHPVSDEATPESSERTFTTSLSPQFLRTLLILAGLSCCVAMSMPQVHIVAYCADLGYGIARGAEMLSLMLAGGIISRLLSGFLADYFGGIRTQLLGSILQCIALILYVPFDGLTSLYIVSFVFGLSQGGIVPSYAVIVREYLPAKEAGKYIGIVVFATVVGMAFGGWLSGLIFDLTKSYNAAFLNGIGWNLLNIGIMLLIMFKSKLPATAPSANKA